MRSERSKQKKQMYKPMLEIKGATIAQGFDRFCQVR